VAEGDESLAFGDRARVFPGETRVGEIAASILRVGKRDTTGSIVEASSIGLYDSNISSHIIGVHPTNGLTYDGVPVGVTNFETFQNSSLAGTALVAANATDTANMVNVFSDTLVNLIPACSSGTWKVLVTFALTAARNVNSGGLTAYVGVGSTGAGVIPRGLTVVNTPISATVMYDAEGVTPSTVIRAMFGGQGTPGTTTRSAASMSVMAVRTA